MPVYVDASVWEFTHPRTKRRMVMCHMLADTPDELFEMADKIGMHPAWFQYKPGKTPHFDLSKTKRALAVEQGAIEVSRRETVRMIRKIRAEPHVWAEVTGAFNA